MLAVSQSPSPPSSAGLRNRQRRPSSLSSIGSKLMAKPSLKVEGVTARSMAEPRLKMGGAAAGIQTKSPPLGRPKLQKSSIASIPKPEQLKTFGLAVSSVSGTVITVQACGTDVCSSVQQQVADKLNLPSYRVTISNENGILKGKKTLTECAVSGDSELFFIISEADKWREMSRDTFIQLVLSNRLASRETCAQAAQFDNYKVRQQYIPRLESIERLAERKRQSEEHQEHLQQSVVAEARAMVSELGVSAATIAIQAKTADIEARCNQRAAELQALKEDAQRDLDEALPALDAAAQALHGLSKADITEVKSFAKPPAAVEMVGEAVCLLFEVTPSWAESKKLLSDVRILDRMLNYDKDNISPKVVEKLDTYMQRPDFDPNTIRQVSVAAHGMCIWVRAMHTYDRVSKVVIPKRDRLMETDHGLKDVLFELTLWRRELAAISA